MSDDPLVQEWTPAGQAAADQMHTEALDALRGSRVAFLVVPSQDGAAVRTYIVADTTEGQYEPFVLTAMWAAFKLARDVTGRTPTSLWTHLLMHLVEEQTH